LLPKRTQEYSYIFLLSVLFCYFFFNCCYHFSVFLLAFLNNFISIFSIYYFFNNFLHILLHFFSVHLQCTFCCYFIFSIITFIVFSFFSPINLTVTTLARHHSSQTDTPPRHGRLLRSFAVYFLLLLYFLDYYFQFFSFSRVLLSPINFILPQQRWRVTTRREPIHRLDVGVFYVHLRCTFSCYFIFSIITFIFFSLFLGFYFLQ
jgi:hypothetical protein